MRLFLGLMTAVLAAAAGAVPASAATTVLDFSGNICGNAGNASCSDFSNIGQSYGDSASVNVSYRSIYAATGTTYVGHLNHWGSGYGDLQGVVWGGGNGRDFISEIVFTPAAGYEIALIGFDAGCFSNRGSCQTLNYSVASTGGDAIGGGSTSTNYPGHVSLAVNSGYFRDGIVLRWGPDGYDVGLDNIAFDVRAIGGAVPEPSTWAMLILGFGAIGAAARRRTRPSLAIA